MTTSQMTRRKSRISTHTLVLVIGGVVGAILESLVGSYIYEQWKTLTSDAPYHYDAPRPYCGNKSLGWVISQAEAVCLPDYMELLTPSAPSTANAIFVDPQHFFSADYSVSVVISGVQPGTCAGILARGNWHQGTGYAFLICSPGQWEFGRLHPGAPLSDIPVVGRLPATVQDTYTLQVKTQKSRYEIYINGSLLVAVSDKQYTSTENVDLLVTPSGSADFADFAIDEIRST